MPWDLISSDISEAFIPGTRDLVLTKVLVLADFESVEVYDSVNEKIVSEKKVKLWSCCHCVLETTGFFENENSNSRTDRAMGIVSQVDQRLITGNANYLLLQKPMVSW